MTKALDILNFANSIAPLSEACDWDNCGLLCGDSDKEVKKALVCLDITSSVVDEAKEIGCDLIISHHPVIFPAIKSINSNHVVYKLVKNDLAAISLHTNLDIADNIGVNVSLAKTLGLCDTTLHKEDFLCVGKLSQSMDSDTFAKYVKEKLNCKGVRYTKGTRITTVGVSSGAGSDAVEKMALYGLDALVTGEIKHHHFLLATKLNLCVVEAGHYNSEVVVAEPLKKLLKENFEQVEFIISKSECDPVTFA